MNLEDFEQYENFKNGNKGKKSKKMRKKKRNSQPAIHSHFLPKTARAMFSRKGGPSNYPVARFYPNEKMIAVIYSTNDRFTGDLFHSYNLAVYNLKGDLLFPTKPNDTDNIFEDQFNLGSTSLKQTVTFSIDEKGNIWKNTYDNIWKNDTKKKGYRNNQLVDFQIKDTKVFQLNKKGIVEKLKAVPSDSRASLN